MLKCVLAVLSFTYVCDAPYFSWLWMLAVWACEWLFLQWHIGDINVCWCGRDPLQRANMCVACAAERMNKNILHRTRTHTHTNTSESMNLDVETNEEKYNNHGASILCPPIQSNTYTEHIQLHIGISNRRQRSGSNASKR